MGYNVINKPRLSINVSDGILYEKGSLENVDELGRTRYETLRNSLRLRVKYSFGEFLSLENIGYWQPAFEDRHDYLIKTSSTLQVKLIKDLSFTAALVYNKFAATDRENLLLTFGFTWQSYF